MTRLAVLALVGALLVAGCIRFTSSVTGTYYVSLPNGFFAHLYGFEFRDDGTMRSFLPEGGVTGTYTLAGSTVTFCISVVCRDLRIDGECLVQANSGSRYCKDPSYQAP